MCSRTIAMLAGTALAVSACGGTSPAATPRPPAPVNVAVFIDDSRVSVSPRIVGAGPVEFIITNQANRAESVAILPFGAPAGQSLAGTAPISPRATAQFTVDFSRPGRYSVATGDGGSASSSGIRAASIRIGAKRPSSDNELLQP